MNTGNAVIEGLQRIFLLGNKQVKRLDGSISGNGIPVQGSLDDEIIVVVEGLEDALSLRQSGVEYAIWATCGATHLGSFKVPKAAKIVIIAADNDVKENRKDKGGDENNPGMMNAKKLMRRLAEDRPDIKGKIITPLIKDGDWNDMLVRGMKTQIKTHIEYVPGKYCKLLNCSRDEANWHSVLSLPAVR